MLDSEATTLYFKSISLRGRRFVATCAPKFVLAVWLGLLIECANTAPIQGQQNPVTPYFKNSYAVVIGLSHYRDSLTWPNYFSTGKDASDVATYLRNQGFKVFALYDASATRTHVIALLDDTLASQMQPDDRLLFFFSGHGDSRIHGTDRFGYLIPYDGGSATSDYISFPDLRSSSQRMFAKHQLFILNSCFGGIFATLGALPTLRPLDELASREAREVLTAGGQDQRVRAVGPDSNTFFTHFLLRALKGEAADSDGLITFLQLAAWMTRHAHNQDQTPVSASLPGDKGGQFVFWAPRSHRADAAEQRKTKQAVDRLLLASGVGRDSSGARVDSQPLFVTGGRAVTAQDERSFPSSGHIRTEARLSPDGLLVADVLYEHDPELSGFCGSVSIDLVDADSNVVTTVYPPPRCVGEGAAKLQDKWQTKLRAAVTAATRRMAIRILPMGREIEMEDLWATVTVKDVEGSNAHADLQIRLKALGDLEEVVWSGLASSGRIRNVTFQALDMPHTPIIRQMGGQWQPRVRFSTPLTTGQRATLLLGFDIVESEPEDSVYWVQPVPHPLQSLEMTMKLPPDRPCKEAVARSEDASKIGELQRPESAPSLDNARTSVVWAIRNPAVGRNYVLACRW